MPLDEVLLPPNASAPQAWIEWPQMWGLGNLALRDVVKKSLKFWRALPHLLTWWGILGMWHNFLISLKTHWWLEERTRGCDPESGPGWFPPWRPMLKAPNSTCMYKSIFIYQASTRCRSEVNFWGLFFVPASLGYTWLLSYSGGS